MKLTFSKVTAEEECALRGEVETVIGDKALGRWRRETGEQMGGDLSFNMDGLSIGYSKSQMALVMAATKHFGMRRAISENRHRTTDS